MEISKAEKRKFNHYLLPHINQDNPALPFIPKFLFLSKSLPLVQKIKFPFSLIKSNEYLRPLDIIKVKKRNSKIRCLTYWQRGYI